MVGRIRSGSHRLPFVLHRRIGAIQTAALYILIIPTRGTFCPLIPAQVRVLYPFAQNVLDEMDGTTE